MSITPYKENWKKNHEAKFPNQHNIEGKIEKKKKYLKKRKKNFSSQLGS
jgi:hypothetical protein